MFIEISGEIFRTLKKDASGVWVISCEAPRCPDYLSAEILDTHQRVSPPKSYMDEMERRQRPSCGYQKRLQMIEPLTKDPDCISDRTHRNATASRIAETHHTTKRRICTLYYRYLAGTPLIRKRKPREQPLSQTQKDFNWAIETFYYSAKKHSLRSAYDMLLLSRYTGQDGKLTDGYPGWHAFRHYFYDHGYHTHSQKKIARDGLTAYQRNNRPLSGTAKQWKQRNGVFQMDATIADIYLVSSLDRNTVVGRPYIYLAVDTATQLIAGLSVGFDGGEQAVIRCLTNAAVDKTAFCRAHGIDIKKNDWPNTGLPSEIITDNGREFTGSRLTELMQTYDIETQALPPFRADQKGLVEKSFDLIQQKFKPLLRGKGVIEPDAAERWAVDYRKQAVLTLNEFTKILIHCILYLNSRRVLSKTDPSLPDTAAGRWIFNETQGQSDVIPIDAAGLYHLSLPRKTASLTRKGILLDGLWYTNNTVNQLSASGSYAGNKVLVAYDPENISRIFVVDQGDYLPFELSAEYRRFSGLTAREHSLDQAVLLMNRRTAAELDTSGRVKAIQEIKAIADHAKEETQAVYQRK